MKVYIIVGLDKDAHIDSAGGFESKSDAYKFIYDNNLGKKIAKLAVLPVTIKKATNEVTEAPRQVLPSSQSVAAAV